MKTATLPTRRLPKNETIRARVNIATKSQLTLLCNLFDTSESEVLRRALRDLHTRTTQSLAS